MTVVANRASPDHIDEQNTNYFNLGLGGKKVYWVSLASKVLLAGGVAFLIRLQVKHIVGVCQQSKFCPLRTLEHRLAQLQRLDAGTAPAKPLGTQSALNANFRLQFRRVRGASLLHASTVAVLCWNQTPLWYLVITFVPQWAPIAGKRYQDTKVGPLQVKYFVLHGLEIHHKIPGKKRKRWPKGHKCCINVRQFLTTHHAFYLYKMRPIASWLSWLVAFFAPPRIPASHGWTMSGAWKSPGFGWNTSRIVNQESDVLPAKDLWSSTEQAWRGFSGPGSLWFVIQSVSLCPWPQGSKDDPFLLKFTWIWSFVGARSGSF